MNNNSKKRKVKLILSLCIALIAIVSLSACSVETTQTPYNDKKPVAKQMGKSVQGIEAGEGSMLIAQKAMDKYGLTQQKGWNLTASSTGSMIAQLENAMRFKHPIVVTGWQPLWIFRKYKLKFLKDPDHVFGQAEHIDAVTHKGFKEKNPGAFKFLSQFHWSSANMSDVMMKTNSGEDPAQAAREFIDANPKLVQKWTNGVPKGHGQTVKLVNVAWDSEIASTNVVAQTLDKMGYNATIDTLEPQPMFISLAKGSADASVSIWLPITHGQYFNQYKKNYDVAGDTLDGAQSGLVVPQYMKKVNTIKDLGYK